MGRSISASRARMEPLQSIFIDTCIFDESKYNFSSASFSSFCEVAKGKGLTLLLPDPIAQEIERHIEDGVKSAINALQAAPKKAPFLHKLADWPLQNKDLFDLRFAISKAAHKELDEFLSLFKVEKLGYKDVNLKEIMAWYRKIRAPFGEGRKRKEFPDAFAIAIIKNYAQANNEPVAVISRDEDIEKACSFYSKLFYYKSLSSFTEVMISADERLETIRELLSKDEPKIVEAISNLFVDLTFCIDANWEGDAQDIEVDEINFDSISVVGIGERGFSIVFEADVYYSAYVSYDDLETAIYDSEDKVLVPIHTIEGTVQDHSEVSGIIKAQLSANRKKIEDIQIVELDDDFVYIVNTPEDEF